MRLKVVRIWRTMQITVISIFLKMECPISNFKDFPVQPKEFIHRISTWHNISYPLVLVYISSVTSLASSITDITIECFFFHFHAHSSYKSCWWFLIKMQNASAQWLTFPQLFWSLTKKQEQFFTVLFTAVVIGKILYIYCCSFLFDLTYFFAGCALTNDLNPLLRNIVKRSDIL